MASTRCRSTIPICVAGPSAQINVRDLPNDFTFLGQLSAISDQNYLDQFNNYGMAQRPEPGHLCLPQAAEAISGTGPCWSKIASGPGSPKPTGCRRSTATWPASICSTPSPGIPRSEPATRSWSPTDAPPGAYLNSDQNDQHRPRRLVAGLQFAVQRGRCPPRALRGDRRDLLQPGHCRRAGGPDLWRLRFARQHSPVEALPRHPERPA